MVENKVAGSRKEEYGYENIAKIMSEEERGMHLSLIDTGKVEDGVRVLGINIETDMDAKTILDIMKGLIKQYEQAEEEL